MASIIISDDALVISEIGRLKSIVKDTFKGFYEKLNQRELFILNYIENIQTDRNNKLQQITEAFRVLKESKNYVAETYKCNLLKEEKESQMKIIENKMNCLELQRAAIVLSNKTQVGLICDTAALEKLIAEIDIVFRSSSIEVYDEHSKLSYVSAYRMNEVQVWNSDGKYVKSIGNGILQSTIGICIKGDYIYVICTSKYLFKFKKSGELVSKIGGDGTGNDKFKFPIYLFVSNGEIYVYDIGNGRIQVFDVDLKYLKSIVNLH